MGEKKKKDTSTKAFFFLRHNNDIDHITPVLYKWLSTERVPTDVIIISNRSFLNDYRINYLRKYKNVKIYFLRDLFKKFSLTYFFHMWYFKYTTESDDLFQKNKYIRKIADRSIKRIANHIFKDVDNGIVVFDWTTTYFVKNMVQIAKEKKYTTISLPHGNFPYINYLFYKEGLDYTALDSFKSLEIFDFIVVENQSTHDKLKKYYTKNKLKILGSSRYCDEWIDINSKLIPTYNADNSNGKLKIVFFMRSEGYPIFWEEIVRTIKLILQFSNIYLIVKHHPRNTNAKKLTKKLLTLYPEVKKNINKNLKFIYEDVNSSSLTKWADLIIDVGTSTSWEPIKQRKPVLLLEYIHANYSTVAYYIKKSEIKCRDGLFDTIQKLLENKNIKFYDEKEREKFIYEIIDVPDKNVLERYCIFLKRCLTDSIERGNQQ